MARQRRGRSPGSAVPVASVAPGATRGPPGPPLESAYRHLADHTTDVVLELDLGGAVRWVSPSTARVLGYDPEALVGSRAEDLWVPDELDLRDRVRTGLHTHRRIDDIDCRVRTADGGFRWMSAHVEPVVDEEGMLVGCIVGIRDAHAAVVADRARRTLSAGNAIVVQADDEDALLQSMCQAAVDAGGYAFAWYGRPVGDPGRPVRAVACTDAHNDYLDEIDISFGDDPAGRGPVGRALRTGTAARVDNLLTDPLCHPWRDRISAHGFRSALAVPVRVDGVLDGAFAVYAGEAHAFDDGAIALLRDVATQLGLGLHRIRETRRLSEALSTQSVLLAAIDQAEEAVVVCDPAPRVIYANAAAARVVGGEVGDLIGIDPRALGFVPVPGATTDGPLSDIDAGGAWHGQITTVGAGGRPVLADGTVTPVLGSDGAVMAYVAVMRDVTDEHARAQVADREHRDRAAALDIIEHVRPSTTVEETAAEFCRSVEGIDGFDGAMVIMFQPDGTMVTYAAGSAPPEGMERGAPITVDGIAELWERTRAGSWMLDYSDPHTERFLGSPTYTAIKSLGATATAYAPIRWGGEPSGALAVVNVRADGPAALTERLPLLAELGSFAGLLFGAQAEQYSQREAQRRELDAILTQHAFHPVFQPVVDIETGAVRGYEALTRVDDGMRPDLRFARAHGAGVGSELERICAEAALDVADVAGLPPDVWLAVNFSPACLLDGTAAAVVSGRRREVIVEITEHAPIESYPALREAFDACCTRFAVDDAGAGFASLRHILELRPDIVKLDIELVRGIDTDPARQAMATGLCEFAAQTGTMLIAEGVETAAEAEAVRRLGVRYVQGYLFGRPMELGAA